MLLHAASKAGAQVLLPCSSSLVRLLSFLSAQEASTQQQQQQQQWPRAFWRGQPGVGQQPPSLLLQQQHQQQQQQAPPLLSAAVRSLRTRAGSGSRRSDTDRPGRERDIQQHHQQQQQQPQYDSPQAAAAADISDQIRSASTPKELLEAVVLNHQLLNHQHIITALQAATNLWPQTATPPAPYSASAAPRARHMAAGSSSSGSRGEAKLVGRQQLERLMLQLSGPFVRALPDYSARDIAAALWCFAKCGLQPPAEMMQASLQELCSWDKVQRAHPNVVSNLAWAAAKLDCRDKQLFSHIAVAALSGQMQQYKPVQLSTLAWAFARAGYQDRALGLALTASAVELLTRQQRQQQQQDWEQQQGGGQPGARYLRQSEEWRFTPYALASMVSSSAGMGWLGQTPELVQLAAEAAVQEPFVYGFRPMDAANLMWGLATTLGGASHEHAQQQQQHQLEQGQHSAAAAAAAAVGSTVLDPQLVWRASLGVSAAALRRVEEAGVGSLCRMVWSCAILSGWVRTRLATTATAAADTVAAAQGADASADAAAAQEALADGRVVLGQLCAALRRVWQQQPQSFGQSVAMTAWALVAADKSGLWRLDTPADVSAAATAAHGAQQQQQQQQQAPPPTLLLQELLLGLQQHSRGAGQQRQLSAGTVSDLAVALTELKPRVDAFALLAAHSPAQEAAAGEQPAAQEAGQEPAAEDGLPAQLQGQMSAAVAGLAAAAWQHAGTPGALEVRDVSRLLVAFCTLQVDDTGLYHDLLQHWSQEAVQGCPPRVLLGALHAAATFTAAQPDLVQSGSLPAQAWQHLLEACKLRWGAFSAEEQRRARRHVRSLCGGGLKGVVPEELLLEASELVSVGPATGVQPPQAVA